ncbi:hypothetical protein B0H16DRAFT_998217 [Mycena metata]|uniref:Uncharacterized protein n=1 Tax=Mycena metata TaxID=1033252 RepID=A0AAD7IIS5_9AGAR|nr:hypothetical protein B0H16DRAFT_998217 [Mycena metata]
MNLLSLSSLSSVDGRWPIFEPEKPKRRSFLPAVFSHRWSQAADTRNLPPPSYESLYSPKQSKATKYMSRNWLKKYMQRMVRIVPRSTDDSESVFPELAARQRRDMAHMFPECGNVQDREQKQRDRERKHGEKERRKRARRLRFMQLLQLAKAPPQGLLLTVLSSVLWVLLAILSALQVAELLRGCTVPWAPLIAFPLAYLYSFESGDGQSWAVGFLIT